MTPKNYYRFYEADHSLSPLSDRLILEIMEFNPISVCDVGAGSGKHCAELHKLGVVTLALDISKVNVCHAMFRNDLPFVALGDDTHLRFLCNMDIVTTCSVLDHIENVIGIIGELKRICNIAVVLAEPQHHDPEMMYWSHDYESHGFVKQDYSWKSPSDNVEYFLWIWKKESDPLTEMIHEIFPQP